MNFAKHGLPAMLTTLLLALALPGPSWGKAAVGARLGWSDVDREMLTGIGDLGGTNMVGLQISLDLMALIEVEMAAEYINEDFRFDEAFIEGVRAAGEGEYEDIGLYATLRVPVLRFPILPIGAYAGGGLNVHWTDLTLDATPTSGLLRVPAATADLEGAIENVAGEDSRSGWHVVLGLRLGTPGGALGVFVEGRYMDEFDKGVPATESLYCGIALEL